MEIVKEKRGTCTFDASSKIKCLVEMALSKVISWSTLHSAIDKLTPTFERSKQVNEVLLYELEKLQKNVLENDDLVADDFQDEYTSIDEAESVTNVNDLEQDQFNAKELKVNHFEEDIIEINEEKEHSEELLKANEDNKSESAFMVDSSKSPFETYRFVPLKIRSLELVF